MKCYGVKTRKLKNMETKRGTIGVHRGLGSISVAVSGPAAFLHEKSGCEHTLISQKSSLPQISHHGRIQDFEIGGESL